MQASKDNEDKWIMRQRQVEDDRETKRVNKSYLYTHAYMCECVHL